jgi:hypothetical protein
VDPPVSGLGGANPALLGAGGGNRKVMAFGDEFAGQLTHEDAFDSVVVGEQ